MDAEPLVISEDDAAELAEVKRWQKRITSSKAKWESDFDRMRLNIDFVFGLQWSEQTSISEDERYVANLTLQLLRQKTAQLYAKNPTFEAVRKKKLDFELWDGEIQSLTEAFQGAMQGRAVGIPNMEAEAIFQDFMQGRQMQAMVKKVCDTLKLTSQHQIDACKPDFKKQMKQLVRRVITCGVGYIRPHFIREGSAAISTTESRHTLVERAKQAAYLIDQFKEDKIPEDDAEVKNLRSLLLSIGMGGELTPDTELKERIEFDFLPATSVIPDERCRQLEEFVAARWVFVEYNLTIEEVNSAFALTGEKAIKSGGDVVPETESHEIRDTFDDKDPNRAGKIKLYEVFDYQAKTHCFVAKGHKYYVQPPAAFDIQVSGFWPLVSIAFNTVEREEDTSASIFPPADVDLIRAAQKEWNRSREALLDQRNANAPTYLTRRNLLSKEDKIALRNREPNQVVELEGVPLDQKLTDVVQVLQVARIDPAVYTTAHLEQDMMFAAGMQQANLGPAQSDVTATVGTIAEQSRITVTSSNVDDLDGFLSSLAQMCGELLLQGMSEEVVKRIAGRGAAWPVLNKEDYLNEIQLSVQAASSGRPNRALEVSNFTQIAPFLIQAGANPFAVIKEGVRRMGDDQLDVASFMPLPGMLPPPGGQPGPNGQKPAAPKQPATAPVDQGQGQMNPVAQGPSPQMIQRMEGMGG